MRGNGEGEISGNGGLGARGEGMKKGK